MSIREGHNERRSKTPLNADIVPERKHMNVHFHQNFTPDGTPETYQQTIDRLLSERKIVKHNFKPKSAIVDEFILDVNSEYFEKNGAVYPGGSYEFAKKFYEEAYRYAIKEAGSEDYIVSAILHADERNKELSERYGHDVFHYHLHVVYVPIFQKELKWTKRAGPELAGKVKEIIPQINHTEKWPRKKVGGKFINEYSKLQDRYFEHMTAAGFPDLQRGERGSAAEHLAVEEYKYQQEKKRVAEVSAQVEQSEIRLGELNEQAEKKKKRLGTLDEQITVKEKAKATITEVEAMGHSLPLVPGIHFTDAEAAKLKSLAKKGVGVDKRAYEYKKKIETLEGSIRDLNGQVASQQKDIRAIVREKNVWKANYDRLWGEVKDFIPAIRTTPQKLHAFMRENIHLNKNREVSR
ncbi:MAG: plasmid recombination protein [Synergistaceae bacterium]|nr:plasmid recombination protein [Synergistaceae bacterium]